MSDLQISLVIVGVVIIAGVVIFNRIQLSRYHRKVHDGFRYEHDDVLLNDERISVSGNQRVEPQFGSETLSVPDIAADSAGSPVDRPVAHDQPVSKESGMQKRAVSIDGTISYIADIRADSSIPHEKLIDLLQQKFDYGKPVHWFGLQSEDQPWEEITLDTLSPRNTYIELKGCLQLADRSGPVTEINLSRFRDMAEDFAAQIQAEAECPDISEAHARATDLDKFCADVDVIMGINIISKDGGAFVGTKIRALAEASGFRLESEGVFKYRDNETGEVLFSLGNFEAAPFLPASMRTLTTHGITFLLDVPRVANGEKVFDQMAHIARLFSSTLNGILVDDNRVPLSESGVKRTRQRLTDIQAAMAAHNIAAGSETALNLFD
ncbi:cell division protein ZipA C-terminal FtsZ-binding domain-containing protein [Nitrosomonas sp.]|uniref:cell division protein ZipA C-terminal FtsZ-binding domain-containing protein n=1 Tax=Nitrosomonas sp. TaxID=42353 RepID=UPI0025D7BF46|nr:cell division protein ZipA C-terminal FtsZ-binding domain-containing protein [Nitrosomonas sp.]MCC6917117.1 cell division protein ZipA C-terminal FtsZ-binding domain-containing protein [Nitrosomonas sp.]